MKNWSNLILLIIVAGFGGCKDDADDPNAQLNKEIAAINTYLTENPNTSAYTHYDASGIRLVISEIADEAPPPHLDQFVTASYTARLFPDNTIFETGTITDTLKNIAVVGLITGLSLLPQGSQALVYIPSTYAFAEAGTSVVPPNTTVVYEINLEQVTKKLSEQTQFTSDTTAIRAYLDTRSITNAVKHVSGIFYTLESPVVGTKPIIYDVVDFNYEGITMSDDRTFEERSVSAFNIFNLIDGLKIGMPLMDKGNTATFYIPSGLGYGVNGNGDIKPNENLIFTIELTSILK